MKAMNRLLLPASALSLLFVSCARTPEAEIVVVPEEIEGGLFTPAVESIRLIPLSSDDAHLLGSVDELIPLGDGFIVCDKGNGIIHRYDGDGRFVCTIGSKGRGPGEYQGIRNIQLTADGKGLLVYSFPDAVIEFTLSGELVERHVLDSFGDQTLRIEDSYLTYYGYKPDQEYRLVRLDDAGEVLDAYLRTGKPVLNMSSVEPVFSSYGEEVFVLDAYSPVLYKFTAGRLEPFLSFDFGRYAIREQFFSFDDVYKGAEFLLSSEFARLTRYMKGSGYGMFEAVLQKRYGPELVYGLHVGNLWRWFSFVAAEGNPFMGSFRAFNEGGALLGVVGRESLSGLEAALKAKIVNYDVLDFSLPDDSYVIAEISLR